MQKYIVRGSEIVGVSDGNFTPPDDSWVLVPVTGNVVGNLGQLEYIDGQVRLKPQQQAFTGSWQPPAKPPDESVLTDLFPNTAIFAKAKKASETDLAVMSEFAVALYADITKNQTLFNASIVNLMKLLK